MPWLVLRLLALKSWLSSRTKNLTFKPVRVGVFAFVVALLFYPAPAHAQTPLWVDQLAQGFAYYAFAVASAITQVIVLLIDVMVPIMTYNNFVGNPVVKAGWAIVRDTVNMFFVVILIIIAFGTIFGAERFKWQQQVPRLLTMAIVVNFSKTLCGIMIDFGQVIMLTFANALREIAAGNFIQLFGLNEIYSASASARETPSQTFDFFAAGLASVLMVMWVLATLVILVAILLFRIIMLWILVVIAPLAWFMKGAEGIIKSDAYSEWWNEFKCLVGIGPILAFFLWLTLAVAGAGNIAANSDFKVDADSNNAGFSSSLLEVNNFLSFLIGMAMLFAGFKTASQFCSGSIAGGKIQSMLKQPAALARTAAGLGLKAGGYGARLTGRGIMATPGALKAGSRYLPPTVRNLPDLLNPLNAQRQARMAGAIGGALGDNAAGRFFKGKQKDIEQRARAEQFAGVNKEKEAMKNKDRPWMQGQLESMIKNPPSTQTGQDAMTALFEEAMKDPRFQKDLLAKDPDAMKKLWASQGKKYEGMAKGNAAKTADLEGFKKKYAHVTGAVDELENADDMKGLAASAWGDGAIQDKASRMKTIINGRTLTALEAAREGHYGEDAKKAAVKGSSLENLEGAQLETQFKAALDVGDKQSAESVITNIERRYSDNATSPEDRARLARSMDRMRAAAERTNNPSARGALSTLNTARGGMETTIGFGLPPVPRAQDDIDRYVQFNYGQSSGNRMDAGMSQLTTAKTDAEDAKTALEGQLDQLTGPQRAIADMHRKITEKRSALRASAEATIAPARASFSNVERQFKNAERLSSEGKMSEDDFKYEEGLYKRAQSELDKIKKRESQKITKSNELKNLQRELQQFINTAGGETAIQEVQQRSQQHRDLQEQIDRLKETRARLQEQRDRRTA